VAKLRERISVSKGARQISDLERFDPKKLDVVEVKEKYQVEFSNRFAALGRVLTLIMFGRVLQKASSPQPKVI
jgi:hypothetical protein